MKKYHFLLTVYVPEPAPPPTATVSKNDASTTWKSHGVEEAGTTTVGGVLFAATDGKRLN